MNDVLKMLVDGINAQPDLPQKVKPGFLQADDAFGLYPTKSGQTVDEDFAGNQEKRLYFEAAIRTQKQGVGNSLMWLVSTYIDQLTDLSSDNFRFLKAEATSEPAISQADLQGYVVYSFDFAVNIMVNKYRK